MEQKVIRPRSKNADTRVSVLLRPGSYYSSHPGLSGLTPGSHKKKAVIHETLALVYIRTPSLLSKEYTGMKNPPNHTLKKESEEVF